MRWTEAVICSALARQVFKGNTCVVPNCCFTGDEVDLLVVTPKLMVIDVEVKVSRADLKRDADKDKWWDRVFQGWRRPEPGAYDTAVYDNQPLQWPRRVWRHFYAMPADIWEPGLADHIPEASGVVLLRQQRGYTHLPPVAAIERKAKSNPAAEPLQPSEVINIARLATLRMWDALLAADTTRSTT